MILKQSQLFLLCIFVSNGLFSNPIYTLEQLIEMANQSNPVIDVIQAKEDAAKAGVTIAEQYLNPSVGMAVGPTKTRTPPTENDKNWAFGISQPLEFSGVRSARRDIAESNLEFVDQVNKGTKINLLLNIKSAFFNVIHNQEILKIADADEQVIQDIRNRVNLRVEVGESPRYELIKADTELLAAKRDAQAAKLRIQESKLYLKGLIGKSMPDEFDLTGQFPESNIDISKNEVISLIENSPRLKQLKAASSVFQNKIKLEKNLVNPGLTLSAGMNQDPGIRNYTIGVSIPLPIWNQRKGQINQAEANLREVDASYDQQALYLQRDIDAAYQRYLIAKEQVLTFEENLLDQAEAVLKVVEAAYRYGERGILEYLDAQRTQRIVRKDYLASRLDYIVSILEMEQLLGSKIME
jgi:cobalt-zinc-cadmium efflux system outer membrane protein